MGQTNLKRTHFVPRVIVTNPQNDDIQEVDFTGYFQVGDTVDVIDEDANGNIISTIADNLTVIAIDTGVSLTLSSVVDTLAATVTPKIVNQSIDDGQDAIDRLYRRKITGDLEFVIRQNILAQKLNTPIVGQGTYSVEDSSFWRVGDTVDILAEEGLVQSGLTIVAVSPNADAGNNRAIIVLNSSVDTSTFTNPFIISTSITTSQAIKRNQERIDEIDKPIENEFLGIGNGAHVVFEAINLFKQSSSKLLHDGRRLRLGTTGTRATLTQGAGNAQLIFTSMILGLVGNDTTVRVQAGAGLTVTISGNFQNGFDIVVNNNAGAATSLDIASAINSNADAKRIIQAQYGGNGSGVVSTFGPTALASGLNNGLGDYAELEQVFENQISATGFKWVSLHIRPNERNRLNHPIRDDEEMTIDYRRPLENVNR